MIDPLSFIAGWAACVAFIGACEWVCAPRSDFDPMQQPHGDCPWAIETAARDGRHADTDGGSFKHKSDPSFSVQGSQEASV